ncbi:MAG: dihydropyrimidinase, partial [Anaerolineales bacterium]|nr:dihydropyrimidinase [Anaerolineales bacterium]
MYDLVIKGGTVITASNSQQLDVAISGEQIVALGHDLNGRVAIDATGKLVIPGGVDIHVHMQMSLPVGVTSTDTFLSGTRAAAFGGTTTIVDFVAAEPAETLAEATAKRRAEADPQVVGDYALHMTIGPDDIAKLDQLPEVAALGIPTYKLYMAYGFRLTDDQLFHAFSAIRDAGGQPVIHAENWDIICALVAENLAAGRTSPHWHPRSRPASLEGEAAGRAIDIANYVGLPLHIFHVSCADVVARIRAARAAGWPITGETCPQYLFLTQEAYDAPGVAGTLPVCAPPLRPQADQDALWAALAADDLQLVTTDHCPFTRDEKARGLGDFSKIPGGVPSIEMRVAGLYQGVRRGLYSANRWVELCSTAPAQLARLASKGDIAPGYDADLVIFDPDRPVTLSPDSLHEAAGWTPYNGLELTGWPETVLRRGEIVIQNGACLAEPGSGRYLP